MKYTRSMLRGFDSEAAKHIANVLHIPLKDKLKVKRKAVKRK